MVETDWADAARAVEQVQPAAVLAATSDIDGAGLAALAARDRGTPALSAADRRRSADPASRQRHSRSFRALQTAGLDRLVARLRAALRVRSLHATVMRRLEPATPIALSHIDPARDATVLLIGRGGAYPRCRSRSASAPAWSARSRSKRLRSISTSGTSTASCSAKVLARAWSMLSSPCWRRMPASATFPSS